MLMANADVQPWGVADFRKKEILERKLNKQQQNQYYHDDSEMGYDKQNLLEEEANNLAFNGNHQQVMANNRRVSRFENSINLLEQHHFNIGSFNHDSSMRVRNI